MYIKSVSALTFRQITGLVFKLAQEASTLNLTSPEPMPLWIAGKGVEPFFPGL